MINRLCFTFLFFVSFLLCAVLPALAEVVDTAWVRRYNGPGNSTDNAYAIAVDGSGNVYVTGQSQGSGTGYDYATIKYDPNGNELWVKRYNGPANSGDGASAIAVDGSRNVYVTGNSYGSGTSEDYATIKYDPNGNELWVKRYNGPGNSSDLAVAIAVDGSGNVYVTGYSYGSGTSIDYATVKYDSLGNELWVKRYNGPGNSYDYAYAIAVDGSGDVYVTGGSYGSGTSYDYATVRYDLNGNELWVKRYSGPGNNNDYGRAIAVDGPGNVYVTGYSYGSETGYDYATIKYDPNGNELWVKRYNEPGNGYDYAYAIVVDGSGNVYVTGRSVGSGTSYDYATIKYNPNGNELWVKRYNGPGNSDDEAYAIASDGSGNVYVTGYSYGGGTVNDYATVKYDSLGNELWVKRYNGLGNDNDWARGIAVDGFGNVYVTGNSVGSGTGNDYSTIKYSGYVTDTLKIIAWAPDIADVPIHLIITAPNSDSISPWFNTILYGSTYDTLFDVNNDGKLDDSVSMPNPLVGKYDIRIIPKEGASQSAKYSVGVRIDGTDMTLLKFNETVPPPGRIDTVNYDVLTYLRGDANKDNVTDIGDIVNLINYVFYGGPAPDPIELGDANCDGVVDIGDVVHLINYVFYSGNPPCS
jgi:hypothetical protein